MKKFYHKLRSKRRTALGRAITAILFIAILILATLFTYNTLIINYGSKVVASSIQKLIKENSGGLYVLTYDSLEIDVWQNSVYLQNFQLGINTDSTSTIKQQRVFEMATQEIRLDVESLWSIWFTDNLIIKNAVLTRPKIKLIFQEKKQRSNTKLAEEIGELINQLKAYLTHLNINFLEVNNASIGFFKEEIIDENLLLEISDLSLNLLGLDWEIDDKMEGLKSNTFLLNIKEQHFILPDSSAKVTAAEINYSLKKNRLTFIKIYLSPQNEDGSFADNAAFYFDKIDFAGIDLNEVVDNNVLIVDSIRVDKPIFKIDTDLNYFSKYVQRKNSNAAIIDSLYVRNIQLDKAGFDISVSNIPLKIDEINSEIQHAAFGGDKSGAFYYKNAQLSLIRGSGQILNKQHAFSFETLQYSSLNEKITFDSLKIWPLEQEHSAEKLFANIPSIQIVGLNENEILKNEITIDDISMSNATLDIELSKELGINTEKDQNLPDVLLKRLSVNQSTISIKTHADLWKVTNGNLKIQDLNIFNNKPSIRDETSFSAFIPVFNYNKDDLKIQASNLISSSNSELLQTSTVTIKNNQLDFKANQVLISNKSNWLRTNPDSLHLKFISFTDYKVGVKWSKNDRQNKSYTGLIHIDSVNVPNGVFSTTIRDGLTMTAKIDEFIIGQLNSFDQKVKIGKYALSLTDMRMNDVANEVFAKSITTNSKEKLLTFNKLQVTRKVDQIKDNIDIKSISLSKFHISQFPEDIDKMTLGLLKINDPKWRQSGKVSSNTKNKTFKINPSGLHNITLNEINILNGSFQRSINDVEQSLLNVNIQLRDIDLSQTESDITKNATGFLYANNVNATIDSLIYKSNTSHIRSANLKLSKDLKLESLVYQNFKTDSLDIKTSNVTFKDVAYNKLITSNSFEASNLVVNTPEVKANFALPKNGNKLKAPLSITINNVEINEASIDITTSANENLRLSPIDLKLNNLKYDSLIDFSETLIPAESIELNTGKLFFTTSDGLNEIQVGQLKLSNNENTLTIANINILPLFSKEAYMEKVGYQTDWIKSTIPTITVEGLNYRRLLNEKAFIANYVKISSPVVDVYRDKNYPDSVSTKKPLPAVMLRNLRNSIDIDSLYLKGADITYREVPVKGINPGAINFSKMDATFQNITNIPASLTIDSTMNLYVKSQVMTDVPFEVHMNFNLNSDVGDFALSGKVAPHNMAVFNDFTENGAFLKIKSGECKGLKFTATADDDLAVGAMSFEYTDFKIALVDKKTFGTKKFEESIASFVANSFIVKKRNLALFRLRKGNIFFERNKNKAIFNYLSKLFISGVSSSVGFKSHKREIKKMKNAGK